MKTLDLPHVQTFGITERPLPLLTDLVLRFELGELSKTEEQNMFKQLEQRGEHRLIKQLKTNY